MEEKRDKDDRLRLTEEREEANNKGVNTNVGLNFL